MAFHQHAALSADHRPLKMGLDPARLYTTSLFARRLFDVKDRKLEVIRRNDELGCNYSPHPQFDSI